MFVIVVAGMAEAFESGGNGPEDTETKTSFFQKGSLPAFVRLVNV